MASKTGKLRNRGRIARQYGPTSLGRIGGGHRSQCVTHRVIWDVIPNNDTATIDREDVPLSTGDPFLVAAESGHHPLILQWCGGRQVEPIDEATNPVRFRPHACAAQK